MSAHVSSVLSVSVLLPALVSPVVRSLSIEAAKTVVHAFISLRLDYCNYLIHGITDTLLRRLQAVQNAAARVVSGTRRFDHISPVLRQLHWLPERQRVDFKLAMLVYKALSNLAPQYCQMTASL